jgi:hypothetical protein
MALQGAYLFVLAGTKSSDVIAIAEAAKVKLLKTNLLPATW